MAGKPLKAEGGIKQILDLRIGSAQLLQLWFLLQGLAQGHLQIVRNQLGNPVDITVCHVQGPPDIPDGRLGAHGSEGYDLADTIATVLFDHILDDFAAAVLAEVNVNIRHRDTFRIEEPLKQQVVGERIEIGDLDGIRYQRTGGRTPPGTDRNAAILGPADKIGDDQEIGRKFHVANAVQLDFQTIKIPLLLLQGHVGILGQDRYHPLFQSFGGQIAQHVIVILAGGRVEVREVVGLAVHRQIKVTALGDNQGVADRLGSVGKGPRHLFRRLDVELVNREFHMGRVFHGLAGLDAEQHLMGTGVLTVEIMAVVRRHQRQLQFGRHLHQALVDDILFRDGVFLQFDVVAVGEQLTVPAGGCYRIFHIAAAALHGHFPLEAGGHGNQSLGAPGQQLAVDAGAVVEPLLVPGRGQVGKIPVPLNVFAEQDQMIGRVGDPFGIP